jgi:hypothetical protein
MYINLHNVEECNRGLAHAAACFLSLKHLPGARHVRSLPCPGIHAVQPEPRLLAGSGQNNLCLKQLPLVRQPGLHHLAPMNVTPGAKAASEASAHKRSYLQLKKSSKVVA